MRLLLAIANPWITFLNIGSVGTAVACLLLQLTLIGWIPAAMWAVHALRQETARPRRLRVFNIMPGRQTPPRMA